MEAARFRLVEVRIGWEEAFEPSCLQVPWDTTLREVVRPLLPPDVEVECVRGTDGMMLGNALDLTGRQLPDRARVLLLDTHRRLSPHEQVWLAMFDDDRRARLVVNTYDPRVQAITFDKPLDLTEAMGSLTAHVTYMSMANNGELTLLSGPRVLKMSLQGTLEDLRFLKDQPREETYSFQAPQFMTRGLDGHYYLIDTGHILCFDYSSGKALGRRQHPAILGPVFREPRGLIFLRTEEILIVDGSRVVQYASGQQVGNQVPLSARGRPVAVADMVVRSDGTLILSDAAAGAVYIWAGRGQEVRKIYASQDAPDRLLLALDRQERLYALSVDTCRVHIFDRDGQALCSFGSRGREAYQLFSPSALAVDTAMRLYISDGAMLKVFAVVYTEESSPIGTSGRERATEAIVPPEETAAPAADEALPGS